MEVENKFLRFAFAGIVNTIFTLIIYWVFVAFVSHQIAYSVSWFFGLLFVGIFYPSKVFLYKKKNFQNTFKFILVYIAVFLLGLFLINFFVFLLNSKNLAILLVLPITSFTNYVLGKVIFND